jgi:transposase
VLAEFLMRGEILGLERRRRWSDETKLAIVMSVGVEGATVTQVAQRHEISRQQIYGWRRELKQKGLLSAPSAAGACFLPVDISVLERASPVLEDVPSAKPVIVELQLRHCRSLRFDSGMDAVVLTRLIRAVEAA